MPERTKRRSSFLSSRFSYHDPALFFSKAQLRADHLDLAGWRLWGHYHRRIPLRQVLHVDLVGEHRLVLWLASGEAVRLRLRQAGRWKRAIEALQVTQVERIGSVPSPQES